MLWNTLPSKVIHLVPLVEEHYIGPMFEEWDATAADERAKWCRIWRMENGEVVQCKRQRWHSSSWYHIHSQNLLKTCLTINKDFRNTFHRSWKVWTLCYHALCLIFARSINCGTTLLSVSISSSLLTFHYASFPFLLFVIVLKFGN